MGDGLWPRPWVFNSRAVVDVRVPLRPNNATGPGRVNSVGIEPSRILPGITKPRLLGPTTHMSLAPRPRQREHQIVDRHELGGDDRKADPGVRAFDDGVTHAGRRRVDDGGACAMPGNRFRDDIPKTAMPSITVPPRPGATLATILVPAARMPAICALP